MSQLINKIYRHWSALFFCTPILNTYRSKLKNTLALVALIVLHFVHIEIYATECSSSPQPQFLIPASLDSGWIFRKGDHISWKEIELDESQWQKVNMPNAKKDPQVNVFGLYWIRCTLVLNQEMISAFDTVSIDYGKFNGADEFYVNGNLIGKTGKLQTPIQSDPDKSRIYSLSSKIFVSGKNVISIRAFSNSSAYGLNVKPSIDFTDRILYKSNYKEIFKIISGFLFISMGFFFILTSIFQLNKSIVFFSLLCIFSGIFVMLNSNYRSMYISSHTTFVQIKFYILVCIPIFFVNFLMYFFSEKRHWYLYLYEAFTIAYSIYFFFGKTLEKYEKIYLWYLYSLAVPVFLSILIFLIHHRSKRANLKYAGLGFLALLPTVIWDIAGAIGWVQSYNLFFFGFQFFLISISIYLVEDATRKYSNYIEKESELLRVESENSNIVQKIFSQIGHYFNKIDSHISFLLSQSMSNSQSIQKVKSLLYHILILLKTHTILDKLSHDNYKPIEEKSSINQLISTNLNSIESLYEIEKSKSIPFLDCTINQDVSLIQLLLYHCIENVYKHTEVQSQIEIKSNFESDYLRISVNDTGKGIPDSIKKYFSEPETTDLILPAEVFSGKGFKIIQSILNFLKGWLEVDSITDVGTKIILYIPTKFVKGKDR